MAERNRVFITGRGLISSAGDAIQSHWEALLKGSSSLGPLTSVELPGWRVHIGGEIKTYRPATLLPDKKLIKVLSRQDVLGLYAASQAIENSGLIDYRSTLSDPDVFNDNTGVYVASPGNKYAQQYDFLSLMQKSQGNMHAFAERLFEEVHPMWLLRILPNNVLAYTSIVFGFKGENHNIVNHACGGLQAILEAYHAIRSGLAERVVVVAYDYPIEPQALFYYDRLGVLSASGLRPFDVSHDGTVLAEGAAALVLESEKSAVARHAPVYAECLGGGMATEGQSLFAVEREGTALSRLIQRQLDQAALSKTQLDFIVAHGNGSPLSDESEANALKAIYNQTECPPVTSYKWAMGHTICASGVIDAILSIESLMQRQVPGIASLTTTAQSCEGINVSSDLSTLSPSGDAHALLINRGFGGMNAVCILKHTIG